MESIVLVRPDNNPLFLNGNRIGMYRAYQMHGARDQPRDVHQEPT